MPKRCSCATLPQIKHAASNHMPFIHHSRFATVEKTIEKAMKSSVAKLEEYIGDHSSAGEQSMATRKMKQEAAAGPQR
eukprot:3966950-Pleurochrysis_carterae.AAC.2